MWPLKYSAELFDHFEEDEEEGGVPETLNSGGRGA